MNILFENKSEACIIKVAEIFSNSDTLFKKINNELSINELESFKKIKNEKRKKEWLGVRILIKEYFGKYYDIKYDEYGSPYINKDYNISVSHSNCLISIILCKNETVGIDIEKLSPKIARIALKFMIKADIDSITDNEIETMYLNWCGKETLYKMYKKGGLDFRKNLKIIPSLINNTGIFTGEIISKNINKKYKLNYRFVQSEQHDEKFLLVWYCGM